MSERYLAGLDVGTTKVTVVVGCLRGASLEIVGAGLAPSAGVRKGVIVDIDATAGAVAKALERAEESCGVAIKSVYAGIAGPHIGCLESYGATGIRGGRVTERDLDHVLEAASTVYVPLDREVLHVMPSDYSIDGQSGIVKPLGMHGVRLEAAVSVVTASQAAVDNLAQCCEQAGLKVAGLVFEGLASARGVLKPHERQDGVILVDIGGGTTDLAVFMDGGLKLAAVLPVGGVQFTSDLAVGLKVTLREAERLKREHGYAVGTVGPSEDMEVNTIDGSKLRVRKRYMGDIILPRCEELFELIAEGVGLSLSGASGACVVLTGGASRLPGIDRVAEARLGMPCRLGVPENGFSLVQKDILSNPLYSTGVGLLLYGYDEEEAQGRAGLLELIVEGVKGLGRAFARPGQYVQARFAQAAVAGQRLGMKETIKVSENI